MSILRSVLSWRMLIVFLMGFSSGLPLLLIGGTLKAWLRQEGVDLSTIGFFSLAGLPYTIKFLWAPLLDRYTPFLLGRRRSWLLLTQVVLMGGFVVMAFSNPSESLTTLAVIAVLIGLFSATQDIAVDAYRREVLKDEELGFGSSLGINGYRAAIYVSGSLALILAGIWSWKITYLIMSSFMLVGVLTTLFAPEPTVDSAPPRTLREAVVGPFQDFFSRPGAWTILIFVLLYKIGDQMANEMLNPFYLDMGFSLEQIGVIAKTLGLVGMVAGATLGGLIILKIGINRSLWVFGALQAMSTACFVVLAQAGDNLLALSWVVGFEMLTAGMGVAAYAGFMASITNRKFTATQYALLTSLMGVPRVIFGSFSGVLAQQLGWQGFFIFCTLIAVPGMALLFRVAPWNGARRENMPYVEA